MQHILCTWRFIEIFYLRLNFADDILLKHKKKFRQAFNYYSIEGTIKSFHKKNRINQYEFPIRKSFKHSCSLNKNYHRSKNILIECAYPVCVYVFPCHLTIGFICSRVNYSMVLFTLPHNSIYNIRGQNV